MRNITGIIYPVIADEQPTCKFANFVLMKSWKTDEALTSNYLFVKFNKMLESFQNKAVSEQCAYFLYSPLNIRSRVRYRWALERENLWESVLERFSRTCMSLPLQALWIRAITALMIELQVFYKVMFHEENIRSKKKGGGGIKACFLDCCRPQPTISALCPNLHLSSDHHVLCPYSLKKWNLILAADYRFSHQVLHYLTLTSDNQKHKNSIICKSGKVGLQLTFPNSYECLCCYGDIVFSLETHSEVTRREIPSPQPLP